VLITVKLYAGLNPGQIQEWVEGCLRGDSRSQELLYKHFFPALYRICQRYCQDDMETMSVLNDGFLKVFTKIHKYNASLGAIEAWIKTVITHTAIDYVRSRNRRSFQVVHLDNMGDFPQEEAPISELSPEALLQGIRRLPQTTRTVLNMHLFEAFSHKQIAATLSISESTSRWHLTEARKKLKQYFSEGGDAKVDAPMKKNMYS
jgi:RNA polymerase sigma factor (sigma-70 family)